MKKYLTILLVLFIMFSAVVFLPSCGGGGGGGGTSLNPYSGKYSWIDIKPYDQGYLEVSGSLNNFGTFNIKGKKKVPYDDKTHDCFGEMGSGQYPEWEIRFLGIGTLYGYAVTAQYLPEDAIAKRGNSYLIVTGADSPDGSRTPSDISKILKSFGSD